ncbi:hypothetical protein [Methylomonas sp. MK1]|uniref:hypothetical protein n=1 Tax=Methylomonas sp. MK1 TaxID=1131552 RepID=UPI0012679D4E|nr:hypothetical protein [Methylomonas sp. MK1]
MKDIDNCISFKVIEPKCTSFVVFPFVVAELALRNNNCGRFNIADEVLVKLVEKKLKILEWSTRIMIPIEFFPEEIKAELLEVRNDIEIFGADYLIDIIPCPTQHLIIPYLINPHANVRASLENLDKFISWVHGGLKNPVDIETTRKTIINVKNWFDNLMSSSSVWQSFINPTNNAD